MANSFLSKMAKKAISGAKKTPLGSALGQVAKGYTDLTSTPTRASVLEPKLSAPAPKVTTKVSSSPDNTNFTNKSTEVKTPTVGIARNQSPTSPSYTGPSGAGTSTGSTNPGYISDRALEILGGSGSGYSQSDYDNAVIQAKIEALTGKYTPKEDVAITSTERTPDSIVIKEGSIGAKNALESGHLLTGKNEFYMQSADGAYTKYVRGADGQFSPATQSQEADIGDLGLSPTDIENYYNQKAQDKYTPYQDELAQSEQDRLKIYQDDIARLEQQQSDYSTNLAESMNIQIENETNRLQQQIESYKQEAAAAMEDLSTRFAFRGFGKSSKHYEAQAGLQKQANDIIGSLMAESNARIAMLRAKASGADDAVLADLSKALNAARVDVANMKDDYAKLASDLRLEAIKAGDDAMAKYYEEIAARAKEEDAQEEVNTSLSDKMGYLVDKYGNPILDDAGEQIRIPSGSSSFDFVAGTKYQPSGYYDPTTGEFVPYGGASAGGAAYGGGSRGGSGSKKSSDDEATGLAGYAFDMVVSGQWTPNQADSYIRSTASKGKQMTSEINRFTTLLSENSTLPPMAQGPVTPWKAKYNPFDYLNPNSDNEPAVIKSGYKDVPVSNKKTTKNDTKGGFGFDFDLKKYLFKD